MKILFDTNSLTDAFRGDDRLLTRIEQASVVWLPFVATAEIRAGFLGGNRPTQNEAVLRDFLSLPGVGILYPDHQTTWAFARLLTYLRQRGTPIPTNDLWIASLAVQHELTLVTRDRHFEHLPQIHCVV